MASEIPRFMLKDLKCSICRKYLSVFPIKVYPDRKIRCGRCCKSDDDGGLLSLYELIVDYFKFPCIRHMEGCSILLPVYKMTEHEKICVGERYYCPMCFSFLYSYEMTDHIKVTHSKHSLENKRFLMKSYSENQYFFIGHEFLLYLEVVRVKNILKFRPSLLTDQNRKRLIVYAIESVDNQLLVRQETTCSDWTTSRSDKDKFEFLLPEVSNQSIMCKFDIKFENGVTTLDRSSKQQKASQNENSLQIIEDSLSSPATIRNYGDYPVYENDYGCPESDPESSKDRVTLPSPPSIRNYEDYPDYENDYGCPDANPESSEDRVFHIPCGECGKLFKSGAGLASHMRLHKQQRFSSPTTNICSKCGKICESDAGLASHMRAHERESASSISSSVQKSPSKTENVCPKCGKSCASGAGLASHLRAHERDTAPSESSSALIPSKTRNACPKCGKSCSSRADLAIHMRAHERDTASISSTVLIPSKTDYVCLKCGKSCASGAGLASHLRAHERDTAPSESSSALIPSKTRNACPKCGKSCSSRADLAIHMRAHERDTASISSTVLIPSKTDYVCPKCGKSCASGAGLASHLRAHERDTAPSISPSSSTLFPSKTDYVCPKCGKSCASGAGLASHMRSHERGIDPSTGSSVWGQSSNTVTNSSHFTQGNRNTMRDYAGFSCHVCGQTCQSGAGLASHMRAHERRDTIPAFSIQSSARSYGGSYSSSSGGFSCPQCGRSCSSGAGLASHMRSHR